MRFKRFRDAGRIARRRRLIGAVLVACVGVSVLGTSASAIAAESSFITCDGRKISYSSRDELLACLLRTANPSDFEPKDMKVAAPSSVINATMSEAPATVGSETPTKRVQEVNRWRPNTQAWIDAKARIAAGSGLTTADLEATSRWKPSVFKAVGALGAFETGVTIGSVLRDGVIVPTLGWDENLAERSFCTREANVATDFFGSLLGADCAPWRLKNDYNALVGKVLYNVSGSAAGVRLVGRDVYGYAVPRYCYAGPPGFSGDVDPGRPNYVLQSRWADEPWPSRFEVQDSFIGLSNFWEHVRDCGFSPVHKTWNVDKPGVPRLYRVVARSTGQVVESMEATASAEAAQWITRVRCLDGTTRVALSDEFQQRELGDVAVPKSVALDGCQPVGVDVGMQRAGKGSAGAGGGWGSTPGGDRTGVSTAEVPTEVQDWMRDFPNCWDGSCLLELRKVVGDVELDCFESPEACVEWFTEVKTQPSKYRCYYGGQLVSIEQCNVYARVFDRSNVQQGDGYADPATGAKPKPRPGTTTGTGTSTGTNPGSAPSTSTNPGAAVRAMSDPVGNPANSRYCWPKGWAAFNPFEWVFQPVKCALEWAFVPRESKLTQVQTSLRLAAINSKPGQIVASLEGWGSFVPSAAGCMGPAVTINAFGANYSGYPLQACDGALATAASMTRLALSILFVILGLTAITRYIGRVFGFTGLGGGSE